MYWPLGVPQIYAEATQRRNPVKASGDGDYEDEVAENQPSALLGLRVSRNGHLFATITTTTMTIWQTSPVVVLASITRSKKSLKNYGRNVSILLRPDSSIAVVQTQFGFFVTYTIITDPSARVYRQLHDRGNNRRQSIVDRFAVEQERNGVPEVTVRFRMVIKVDAGIRKALALDDELVVATEKPAAVQCISWTPDNSENNKPSTELLSRMKWMQKRSTVVDMVYDRGMSLAVWITNDGRAYAVTRGSIPSKENDGSNKLFRGYEFHKPLDTTDTAINAAINAKFSLLAVACTSGKIQIYSARDYVGSVTLSLILQPPASLSSTGVISSISYSPDGYCLFAGYERGWAFWSVYGKPGGSSFMSDRALSKKNSEGWLLGILEGFWLTGGSAILLTCPRDDRLWILEMAKSAVTGCFCAANVSRTVLLTSSSIMVYRGYELPQLQTISADASLWHHVQIPQAFLANQRPLRCAVISSDGRYVALAGRRGLAHYSVSSGRWKTFSDSEVENSFVVRGGMSWYQHILIAAVETNEDNELRLYSRELGLDRSSVVHVEKLPSPVVIISLSGQDSLLVYTYENILYHFVINTSSATVSLVRVGQIALNGIVRAPARVRAVSWILPDHQLRDGDPSQDVAHASVIFLVDAKLVLLQSSSDEDRGLRYDMRVIANNVEYFDLVRDQVHALGIQDQSTPGSPLIENIDAELRNDHGLKDSLWFFDGTHVQCWMDVESLLESASTENDRELPQTVRISTDFYPSSIVLSKGIILGVDADLVQRRDINFALFRLGIRTQLFLPQILRRYLAISDINAATILSNQYEPLPYFPHALEILLYTVLEDEVESPPASSEALLPLVISFLSSFPSYLDILVQCTRKTEVRSWRTLFAHLPSPQTLFETSLAKGMLKTAGGYLLVLHTLEEAGSASSDSEQCVRLLQKAKENGDWELCKELTRFLMALDESGNELRKALQKIGLQPAHPSGDSAATNESGNPSPGMTIRLKPPRPNGTRRYSALGEADDDDNAESTSAASTEDDSRRTIEMLVWAHLGVDISTYQLSNVRNSWTCFSCLEVAELEMEDYNSETDSDYTSYWRDWFISSRGHEYFCEIDEEYLTDRFNLTGINVDVQYYQYALDLVTDVFELDCDDDMREQIEKSARHLYGLVHARYITTTRGLAKMLDKYKKGDFGKCPRVMCYSHPLLPTGLSDNAHTQSVKLYCGKCEDLYNPKSSRHANIDGAYFGTSFQNILFQVYPTLVPEKTIRRYEPRVFGFKVHATAALERWQSARREEMLARLRDLGFGAVFKEEIESGEEAMEDDDDGEGIDVLD